MPSTLTSRPALDGLGHAGFDDHAFAQGFPVGVDGRALAPQQLSTPSSGSNRSTTTSIDEPGCGQVALELIDGENSLALASQVDKDALAAHADDRAGARPGPTFLASLASSRRIGGPFPAGSPGRARQTTRRVESGHGGLELGFQTLSHCRLSGTSRLVQIAARLLHDRLAASVVDPQIAAWRTGLRIPPLAGLKAD